MFIFVACVAFVIADTARAISDISPRYLDTAYTLGANRWQTIMKVLVPLAMPIDFRFGRLLFGLAFGYIMLAESMKMSDEVGRLGLSDQDLPATRPARAHLPDHPDHSRRRAGRRSGCCIGCSASCFRIVTAATGAEPARCGWRCTAGMI